MHALQKAAFDAAIGHLLPPETCQIGRQKAVFCKAFTKYIDNQRLTKTHCNAINVIIVEIKIVFHRFEGHGLSVCGKFSIFVEGNYEKGLSD